jgi:hypothetical protein
MERRASSRCGFRCKLMLPPALYASCSGRARPKVRGLGLGMNKASAERAAIGSGGRSAGFHSVGHPGGCLVGRECVDGGGLHAVHPGSRQQVGQATLLLNEGSHGYRGDHGALSDSRLGVGACMPPEERRVKPRQLRWIFWCDKEGWDCCLVMFGGGTLFASCAVPRLPVLGACMQRLWLLLHGVCRLGGGGRRWGAGRWTGEGRRQGSMEKRRTGRTLVCLPPASLRRKKKRKKKFDA